MRNAHSIRRSIARWRATRQAVLGAILLAGSLATSAALVGKMARPDASTSRVREPTKSYGGVGIEITFLRDGVRILRVFEGSPADGKLVPGMYLVAVDDMRPDSLEGWATAIRGEPGSSVTLEVARRCHGHQKITLVRDVIHVRE
jgi:C-terminal processing protease CtpA/Prc